MHEAVVYLFDPRDIGDFSCLAVAERAKAERFVRPHDARAWAATRVALRRVLAGRLDVPAGDINFTQADRSGLALAEGAARAVSFNVSHSDGLAVVAVSDAPAVGVDVEAVRPISDLVAVARRVLRPEACAAIEGSPIEARLAEFHRQWARHEARLKCRGTGIVEPDQDDGRTEDLSIFDLPVGPRHAGALSVLGPDARYRIVALAEAGAA